MKPIAALYVQKNGCYYGLPGVDPWDKERDARKYDGPWPVVAHPPCARWCRLAKQVERRGGKPYGADDDCFASALTAVRRWGGVLEHPEGSGAWPTYDLAIPIRHAGWVPADFEGGFTCYVEQGHYGHRARKGTWLYACHASLPSLPWGASQAVIQGPRTRTGAVQRMSKRERAATPAAFRDLLISIARSVGQK